MKKTKKVLALFVAMIMALGMTMTTMAAPKTEATITVNNAGDATLEYAQVIKTDTSTRTGWAFVNEKVAQAYLTAFEMSDAQTLLEKMAKDYSVNNQVGNGTDYAQALSNVAALSKEDIEFKNTTSPITVDAAGVYAINATEKNYTYSHMAAFVGFGEMEGNEYPSLTDKTIEAKKTPTTTTKSDNDDDNVSEIGKVITYTVETYVPRFDSNDTNKTFSISDKLYGGTYYLTGESDTVAKVEVEGVTPNPYKTANDFVVTKGNDENGAYETFAINLDDLVNNAGNEYAGKKVTVTYTVKVTGTTVSNNATSHVGDDSYNSDEVKIFTADIEMTKYAEDATKEDLSDNPKLQGAGFVVYKEADGVKQYAKFDDNNKLSGWTTDEKEATEVFTDENGKVKVEGLDVGTYYFKEKTAPKGYSVSQEIKEVVITQEGEAKEVIHAFTEMVDTKLSSLPSTGGIGTTIFTIGGCVIMIAAAGLFFASRKKENK